jgi:ABC-2 type transport system ATP-binding protein
MSEMALTAAHLIIIGRGRLLAAGSVASFIDATSGHHVHALSPNAGALAWEPWKTTSAPLSPRS